MREDIALLTCCSCYLFCVNSVRSPYSLSLEWYYTWGQWCSGEWPPRVGHCLSRSLRSCSGLWHCEAESGYQTWNKEEEKEEKKKRHDIHLKKDKKGYRQSLLEQNIFQGKKKCSPIWTPLMIIWGELILILLALISAFNPVWHIGMYRDFRKYSDSSLLIVVQN